MPKKRSQEGCGSGDETLARYQMKGETNIPAISHRSTERPRERCLAIPRRNGGVCYLLLLSIYLLFFDPSLWFGERRSFAEASQGSKSSSRRLENGQMGKSSETDAWDGTHTVTAATAAVHRRQRPSDRGEPRGRWIPDMPSTAGNLSRPATINLCHGHGSMN